jgi:hypothetical protein
MVPVATGIVLALRWLIPPRGLDDLGPVALRDTSLSIVLWLVVALLAAGAGRRLLGLLRLRPTPSSLMWLLSEALGLGAISSLLLALGLIGWLTPAAIGLSLILLSVLVARPTADALAWVSGLPGRMLARWRSSVLLPRLAMLFLFAIFGLALLQTLTPPWDYDSLMYHLVGPRLFLEAHRIYPVPNNWYVNGPFNAELLYLIGMGFGDDVFPKLVHYLFGLLAVSATWIVGKRWIGGSVGWLAACVLVGIPTVPVWASFAYIDLAWALYEFLALACLLEWWEREDLRWLALAGLFLGLAMGTKYIAVAGLAILGLAVLWRVRREGWRAISGVGLAIGVPAVLVALPWYLKNLVWFGNPVYPLYFGGPEWSARRLALYMGYLNSFGTGKGLLSALALPWNVFAQHERFGAVMNLIDMPSLFFLLVFAYPFLSKNRVVTLILFVSLARVGIWFAGSQQLRFLLPIAPGLSITSAYVIEQVAQLQRKRHLPLSALLPSLAVGLLGVTLFYQVVMLREVRPLLSPLGFESRSAFLTRMVKDFAVGRMALQELPEGSRVLLIGDGRGYYCLPACTPDPDHFRWSAEISDLPSEALLTKWLAERGVTHILFSIEDLDFLLQHDQQNVVRTAVDRLNAFRQRGCLIEIHRDEWVVLYEVACLDATPQAESSGEAPSSTNSL